MGLIFAGLIICGNSLKHLTIKVREHFLHLKFQKLLLPMMLHLVFCNYRLYCIYLSKSMTFVVYLCFPIMSYFVFQIAAIVFSRQNRVPFDTSRLDNLFENIVLETTAERITPLVVNPGRILLTSARLYFQPFNNVENVSLFFFWFSQLLYHKLLKLLMLEARTEM